MFLPLQKDVGLYWSKSEGRKVIEFNGVPFCVAGSTFYDCQFGQHYYKQEPKIDKKVWLQGTRKIGCAAHIEVKSYMLLYTLSTTDDDFLSKWKLRCRKKEKLNELKHKLQNQSSDLKVQMKYYVLFPFNEALHGHPIGTDAVHSQKLHPHVSQKIMDMVKAGMTDVSKIRRSLSYYVDHSLCRELGS